jgi:hypothetical protein
MVKEFEVNGRMKVQGAVGALAILEDFDVIEDLCFCLPDRSRLEEGRKIGFDLATRGMGRFGNSSVPATPSLARIFHT